MIPNKKSIINLLVLGLLVLPASVYGQVLPPCTATGNCGLCDFIQTFINIIRWVLGILGGSALFLMVWHGFTWLTSGGNNEKIESGRKGLMHTVIGIFIIIGSWFIINAVMVMLIANPGDDTTKANLLFKTAAGGGQEWFKFCAGTDDALCQQGYGEGTPCGDGNFCLLRCGNWNAANGLCAGGNEKITCGLKNYFGNLDYENACQYWSCHSSRTEFQNYNCTTNADNCVSGKILGPDYCDDGNNICCEIKAADNGYKTSGNCPVPPETASDGGAE